MIRPAVARTDFLERGRREEVLRSALRASGIDGDVAARVASRALASLLRPDEMALALAQADPLGQRQALVAGSLDSRLIVLPARDGGNVVCSLGNRLDHCPWPLASPNDLTLASPLDYVSRAELSAQLLDRLSRPHVKLIALYHPENFPLPRMALGISDICRSLRKQLIGKVTLCDMQLGNTVDDVIDEVERERPDIIGISATFGQQDILDHVLAAVTERKGDYRPTVVLGGSLSALNARLLLERMPGLMIAMGPGEMTMCDVVRAHIGELERSAISDISFVDGLGKIRRTHKVSNRQFDDTLPELDLLSATLDRNGVMQLESSRGCSYACSFCPREHKGIWAGDAPENLDVILPELAEAYTGRTRMAHKIFLVDEEFVGYRPENEALPRALGICHALKRHGFRFETSSRIDQVYRPTRDKDWHVNRMRFWKRLVSDGLDRCLFGVESGVDTILTRFNKKTTSHQNVCGLRILSACRVPMRCTYITFDPLMSLDELIDSYRFQGRQDILLRPLPDLPEEELFELIHDDGAVAQFSARLPFYEEISYMLVSMECLIGSKYLAEVEERGLAGEFNLAMGRREARFIDERIARMSYYGQCWIDRNFSLDYTLKSVEKFTDQRARARIRQFRTLFKKTAYHLLGAMLAAVTGRQDIVSLDDPISRRQPGAAPSAGDEEASGMGMLRLMDERFAWLRDESFHVFDDIATDIGERERDIVAREMERWARRTEWKVINGAEER